MDQLHDIWHFAPQTWDRSINVGEINIYSGAEYDEVEFDICKAVKNASGIQSLTRVQNIFDFGMFLMRSQVLAVDNRQETYYKTRRYVTIPAFLKEDALANNLDHRHLNMNTFVFKSHLDRVAHNELLIVVRILTNNSKKREIVPYDFTEYYIEYVVEIKRL